MQVSTVVLEKGVALFDADVAALRSLGGMDGAVYAYEQDGEGFILKFVPVPPDRHSRVQTFPVAWGQSMEQYRNIQTAK